MANQDYVGLCLTHLARDLVESGRPELRIEQGYLMPVVQERAAYAEESEWWQMVIGYATSDRWMWRIDNQDAQEGFSRCR